MHLPRTTYDIYNHGYKHVPESRMQPGDVIELFGFSHVAIYVGHGYVIHESASKGMAVHVTLTYLRPIDAVLRPGA